MVTAVQFMLSSQSRHFLLAATMASPVSRRLHSYDEAIKALNTLQTNSFQLQQVIKERQKNVHLNLPKAMKYLQRSGLSLDDLDSLNVIHVSGTKGKGSTCAFAESLLRRHGLRTGFFSSPHLVAVTERIRINGAPIEQEKFSRYFWPIFNKLCRGGDERPPYFQFLTLLAFHIFVHEGVDVAIVEVGIGGTYDTTNIVRKPVVCGITSLGIDHTALLGNTVAEIAWHKAGIMKPGVPCITSKDQPLQGLEVLKQRAFEIGTTLLEAPRLGAYDWGPFPPGMTSLYGEIHAKNASVALQLTKTFLSIKRGRYAAPSFTQDKEVLTALPFKISKDSALALRLTSWPGRAQVLRIKEDVTFFLDGAHTADSIRACAEWFKTAGDEASNSTSPPFRVLMFNVTKERKGEDMLDLLAPLRFDLVIFCSTMSRQAAEADNTNFNTSLDIQMKRCKCHQEHWNTVQSSTSSIVIPHVNDALAWLTAGRRVRLLSEGVKKLGEVAPGSPLIPAMPLQILVTGSFWLVGGVLEQIQPDVCYRGEADVKQEQEIEERYRALQCHPPTPNLVSLPDQRLGEECI